MKDETTIPEQMEYRIALIQPHSGKLLVMRDSGGNRLPRLQISASSRATLELRHTIRQRGRGPGDRHPVPDLGARIRVRRVTV